MKKKQVKRLRKIVETPSPTGAETALADLVRKRLAPFADEITTDTMGSVHAVLRGLEHGEAVSECADSGETVSTQADSGEAVSERADSGKASGLTLMLAAHMDEIGLMVTYISDDGFLSVAAVGGVDPAILPGMRVRVHTASGALLGVVGRKPIHLIEADDRKTVTPLDKLVIDLGMPGERVKEVVRVGDQITFAVGFERLGDDMAVSRSFDDKVGVYIACRVMENLASDPAFDATFIAAITTQEEIGTRGAMTSAHALCPDVALAFDVTHATDYPGIDKAKYGEIVCGRGPVIARGPNINPVVYAQLVRAAEEEGLAYQLEAEPSVTGTDARAIQVTRGGIPTGLVSIPLRYMHTPTEVINLSDVEGAVRLITRFAINLTEVTSFVPGMGEECGVGSAGEDDDAEAIEAGAETGAEAAEAGADAADASAEAEVAEAATAATGEDAGEQPNNTSAAPEGQA